MNQHAKARRILFCERLEPRCMLSSLHGLDDGNFQPVLYAGDPKGLPADSPTLRVDPNTTSSPFSGVGSLTITLPSGGAIICTATPIDATHLLTAAHCLDSDNNGSADVSSVTFNANYRGNLTAKVSAASWDIHPDFTGVANPAMNDDLAVITLSQSLRDIPALAGMPIYSLASSDMVAGATRIYMVGYGRSGNGVAGYTTEASLTVKRDGENMVDGFFQQDDAGRPSAKEVFRFDFDGPTSSTNVMGGRTLGNDKETNLGAGDSGGPSFVRVGGAYYLAGVNTFVGGANAPKFGSTGGGMNVFAYANWIRGPHPASASLSTASPSLGTRFTAVRGAGFAGVFSAMAHWEDPANETEPFAFVASFADAPRAQNSWLASSRQAEFDPALPVSSLVVAAADAPSFEVVDQAIRASLLEKQEARTSRDATSETEDWATAALDVIFAEWASL